MIKLIISFLLVLLIIPAFSQNSTQFDPVRDDIGQKLDPLNALIDSALKHDPNLRFRDLQLIANKCKLKADRSSWAKNVGVQTDVRYGTFNIFSTNTAEGQNPDLLATRSSQTTYGVGAYIKFPLFDIINHRNQIAMSKSEVDQAASMVEFQRNEVRQMVIKLWNDLILKQSLLKIKSKYLGTSKVNMEMVEKEFQNGIIPLAEYSRISEGVARAEADFETARIEFITSYMILEEIVGFQFNLTNEIKDTNEGN